MRESDAKRCVRYVERKCADSGNQGLMIRFRPEVDAEYVGQELAFEDTSECVAFLKAYEEGAGMKFLAYKRDENTKGKNKGSYIINTKDALPCFTDKLATFTKVDIKGQL